MTNNDNNNKHNNNNNALVSPQTFKQKSGLNRGITNDK